MADEEVKHSDSIYKPVPARIASMMPLTEQDMLFTIELPHDLSMRHGPGQFVQVSLPGLTEAPFSIANSPTRQGCFELGIRKAGQLTTALHQLQSGATIGIRGPFGRPPRCPSAG